MTTPDTTAKDTAKRNLRLAVACVGVFVGMVGLAFASVPLYALFCRVTGYGGTPAIVSSAEGIEVLDRLVNVRFDTNLAPGMPWQFEPVDKEVTLKIGELTTVHYKVRNTSDKPVVGTAVFNVTPDVAGPFFSKMDCFCFTEQRLEADTERDLAVTFYVDPAMVDDPDAHTIQTITLSYTFFPVAKPTNPVAALDRATDDVNRL